MRINLCFHGIGTPRQEREPGEARYWISRETFKAVLDLVVDHPSTRLSFDDGNASDIEIGLPALRERGLSATFFALAGRLEDPASLDRESLVSLRSAGMAIGSHGWSHIPWRGLDGPGRVRELVEARQVLAEASGGEVTAAALPLGRYDRRLLGQLRETGYRTVYTSDRFPARPGSWLQARYSLTAGDTVGSIRELLTRPPGIREGRNLAASLVKRTR